MEIFVKRTANQQPGLALVRRTLTGSVALAVCAALYAPAGAWAQEEVAGLEEVVVTATRRAESVQDVPISVAVFGQEQMDVQGIKQIDDIARLSPSLQFSRGGGGFGSELGNAISIRGMGASAGPATTGVYIDDTPVQVGATIASGSFTDNAYPMLFDIQRVEVLNGPQGTLFGSGSMGGAVRFIQPAPNMDKSSVYARTEVSSTEYGAPSYEAGLAGGAPLVDGKLGFRASVWGRHSGGYIDHVDYYTGKTINPNNNYSDAVSARLALGWQATDSLMITPSFYYQRVKANGANAFYFPNDETAADPDIAAVDQLQPWGNPGAGDYVDLHQLNQYSNQTLKLSALQINWQALDNMELFSNTSYYERKQAGVTDFGSLEAANWAGVLWPADPTMVFPGHDSQGNKYLTQELRLQSTDADARLKWVLGAFYSDNKTTDSRNVENPWLPDLLGPFYDIFFESRPLADGIYSFKNSTELREKQKAAFGQADLRIAGGLIGTIGLRYSDFDTSWTNYEGGPVTGVDWPGPDGAPTHGTATASKLIPKIMLSYKADNALTYLSATKGFRNGGVNAPINNPACAGDLAELGLTSVPTSYNPDSLWSYELGTKLQLLDRRLAIDAAIYQYDWSDMISNQFLSNCTLSYTANIGTARGRGFEFAMQYRPVNQLTLGVSTGYHRVEATQTVRATPTAADPEGAIRVRDGNLLGDGGRVNANVQYSFPVGAENDGYFRADYTYSFRPGFENDALTTSYIDDDRRIFLTPGYAMLNARVGVNVQGWDVSLFSNNILNKQPLFLNRATVTPFGQPTSVKTGTTLLPRTIGITAVYRY